MAKWMLKALVQRGLGMFPNPHRWNNLLQRAVSRSGRMSRETFLSRLAIARRHLDHYRRYGNGPKSGFAGNGSVMLEFGVGWYPVVPVALWLGGARRIHALDIQRHIAPRYLAATLDLFARSAADGSLAEHLPGADPARVAALSSIAGSGEGAAVEDILRECGVNYLVGDIARSGIARDSVDLVCSNAVLEYPGREQLAGIFGEMRRVMHDGAVSSHWIDFSDEYAYFDKSISALNFLRYPSRLWRLAHNPFIPMSRLRISDLREEFERAGFAVVEEDVERMPESEFAKLRVAAEFERYDREDLRVLGAWMTAVPARRVAVGGSSR